MAEILCKAHLFSSYSSGEQQQKCGEFCVVPKTCSHRSGVSGAVRRFPCLKLKSQVVRSSSCSFDRQFHGKKLVFEVNKGMPYRGSSAAAQRELGMGKGQNWWEKGLQPNMREVTSAQDLVESLLNAGDKLVVVDFFLPGCSGCRALHPKICQLAEMNPDVQFLQVNNEEHNSMCQSLKVHVLPFFRFYRGSHGRLCSFSCTNASIKKFKDALAKHTPDRCSLGPTKGLEEEELLALAANKDLNFTYTPKPVQPVEAPAQQQEEVATEAANAPPSSEPLPPQTPKSYEDSKERQRALITAGRWWGQFVNKPISLTHPLYSHFIFLV